VDLARRRPSRIKAGVAIAGAVVLGIVAALAAAASAVPAVQRTDPTTPGPAVDMFGQSTKPGPGNQPQGAGPGDENPGTNGSGNPGGTSGGLGQAATSIVTAPS
jgi:hypothetical protein